MNSGILKDIIKNLPDDLDLWFSGDFEINEIRIDNCAISFINKTYEIEKEDKNE